MTIPALILAALALRLVVISYRTQPRRLPRL